MLYLFFGASYLREIEAIFENALNMSIMGSGEIVIGKNRGHKSRDNVPLKDPFHALQSTLSPELEYLLFSPQQMGFSLLNAI